MGFAARLSVQHPLGRAARLVLVAAVLGGALVLDIPLCPFAIVTRHPCPGCGLTRATLELLHGHLSAALHFHPLAIVIAPLVIGAMLYNGWSYVWSGRWSAMEGKQGRVVTAIASLLLVVLLGVWIARFFGAFGGPVPV